MNIVSGRDPPLFVRVKDRLPEHLAGRFLASSGSLKVAERKRDSGCGVSSVRSNKNEDDKRIGQLRSLRVNGPTVCPTPHGVIWRCLVSAGIVAPGW